MSVPPSERPSSTPPSSEESEGPSQDKKTKKDFKLPVKDKKEGGDQKKKSLFDIAGGEENVKDIKQEIEQEQMEEAKTASSIEATQTSAAVTAISKLIQSVVAEMRVGQVDGKDFTSMELSKSGEIPQAFAGSNLTMSYQENGLTIHFDNFMTPQQENNAITLVEKNKDQLLDMVQALQAKNITIQEMSIGRHVVTLPRVQALPPPFQPSGAGAAETRREQERGEEEGEEGAGPE